MFLAKLTPGETVTHSLRPQRNAWIHVAEGEVKLNGHGLNAGDAAAVSEAGELKLTGIKPAQVLVFDLN